MKSRNSFINCFLELSYSVKNDLIVFPVKKLYNPILGKVTS